MKENDLLVYRQGAIRAYMVLVVVGTRSAYLNVSSNWQQKPFIARYQHGTHQYRRLLAWCLEPTQAQQQERHIPHSPSTPRKRRWKRSVEAATDPRI